MCFLTMLGHEMQGEPKPWQETWCCGCHGWKYHKGWNFQGFKIPFFHNNSLSTKTNC